MTYSQRVSFLIVLDSLAVLTSIFFGRFLIGAELHVGDAALLVSALALLLGHHVFSFQFKLYNKAWEYASVGELLFIGKAVTLSILVAAVIQQFLLHDVYFRLLLVTWMLHVLLIGGSRFCWRLFRDTFIKGRRPKIRTMIVGAGAAGTMVARQLINNSDGELLPVAFIDDSIKKQKLDILGVPVIGGVDHIAAAAEELNIDHIIIAIPSLGKKELNVIYKECIKTKAKTQILPMLEDIVSGKVSINQFRDVQVEDLLGRELVQLDMEQIASNLTGKVVLVTGAGGSIGSEICRQAAHFRPKSLILLGHGENSIYSIEMELRELYGDQPMEIFTEIADLQDAPKMLSVMNRHRPHVVYHAAAHKHVPLMESNPEEALKNNVMGTINAARAASRYGVGTFVMISTDKAVNPTSVMGASKKMAEMLIQHLDSQSETKFVTVRFGNVLGSRGSVIPLFKKQIEKGGPLTITHPDMIRYFMTIPEASRLVIQAGALARGGEIFVLDMGEPVKIVDLATNLIKLSGQSVDDIGIEFTGVRPGEKLFEELLQADEVHDKQVYPKIYIGKAGALYIQEIEDLIDEFGSLDKEELRDRMLAIANHRIQAPTLVSIPS